MGMAKAVEVFIDLVMQYEVLHTKMRVDEIKVGTLSIFAEAFVDFRVMSSKCTECDAEN